MTHARSLALLIAGWTAVFAQAPKFSGSYDELSARQKELVQRWANEFEKTFNQKTDAVTLYNHLPVSARTTFSAVTHALERSKITTGSGKSQGSALDLVDIVERVAGKVPGERGDSQFRIYVYLTPGAVDKLYNAREFKRDHDNTVYHIGYPINFRQQGGVPSIQISVTQTGLRADIDVDYRPSAGVQALTSGHLTAANSDVRAGDNHTRHVGRWEGLAAWWRDLVAGLLTNQESEGPDVAEVADFSAASYRDLQPKARGPLPELMHGYLSKWLVQQEPVGVLSAISISAYPCVAEFTDGSKPDSKMALFRILKQLQMVNERLGKVANLENAVRPAAYPLPESQTVKHAYEQLFTVQRVHDDIAWALDCRIRLGLNTVESIPRPPHQMNETYVVSFRLNEPTPSGLIVQTWHREGGEWKLVSFDIERNNLAPPPDLLTRAAKPLGSKTAAPKLQATVDGFLTVWLLERNYDVASSAFLPESHDCVTGTGVTTRDASDRALQKFLAEVAGHSSKEKTLARALSAAQAAHPGLKPLMHTNDGAYFMAEADSKLMKMYACGTATASKQPSNGVLTAFHLSRSHQPSAGVVSLYWKNVSGDWRIAGFNVSAD